jgi:hypothetical protein
MNCEHCKELLPGLERAELASEQLAAVATHVHGCASCAQAAVALRELNALLDIEAQPSPGLRQQVLTRLQQEAASDNATLRPAATLSSLFASLWPSRPLGAFSYSLALVVCGMFSGQLLPAGTLIGADVADIPAERLVQLCRIPDLPLRDIL